MAERKKFTITEYRPKITKSLAAGPRTVPELAKDIGFAPRTVLWYIMTYYKYGLVSIAGKTDEGYYRYALKEKKK
jgi:hypothetical protein